MEPGGKFIRTCAPGSRAGEDGGGASWGAGAWEEHFDCGVRLRWAWNVLGAWLQDPKLAKWVCLNPTK